MDINYTEFKKIKENEKGLIIIEFWASWCPPCKMMDITLKNLKVKFKEFIKIYKINVDKYPLAKKEHEILGLPALLFFLNGTEINRYVGAKTESQISSYIKDIIFGENNNRIRKSPKTNFL